MISFFHTTIDNLKVTLGLLAIVILSCSTDNEPETSCETLELKLVNLDYANCGVSNGTMSVNASGGKKPYTYWIADTAKQLSNTFTDLRSNYHTVFVEDANGCLDSLRSFLGSSEALRAVALVTPSGCNDNKGSIEVVARNGLQPYRYQLGENSEYTTENTFSGLTSGEYSVWVKDNVDCFLGIYPVVLNGIITEDIQPITDRECSTPACHGGGVSPQLNTGDELENNAEEVIDIATSETIHQNIQISADEKNLLRCWLEDIELKEIER